MMMIDEGIYGQPSPICEDDIMKLNRNVALYACLFHHQSLDDCANSVNMCIWRLFDLQLLRIRCRSIACSLLPEGS